MPNKFPTPCNYPQCPLTTKEGYCEEHRKVKRKQSDEKRSGDIYRNWYHTVEWQRIRTAQLIDEPFCVWLLPNGTMCGAIAQVVDHIVPLRHNGAKGPPNVQSLCKSHHDYKTVTRDGGFGKKKATN